MASEALRDAWTDEVRRILSETAEKLVRGGMSGGRALARLGDAIDAALCSGDGWVSSSERCIKCDRQMEAVLTCPMCGGNDWNAVPAPKEG